MSHVLQKLENNEAILLMYLANELDAEDRADVEQMLSVDPGLRAELERLRSAEAMVEQTLRDADQSSDLPVQERVAVRQVGRIIRQWKIDRTQRQIAQPQSRGLKYPWWSYPAATAAAVMIAFLVWFGAHDGPLVDRTPPSELAIATNSDLDGVASAFEEADEFMQEQVRRESAISAAESELLALSSGQGDVLGLNTVDSNQ